MTKNKFKLLGTFLKNRLKKPTIHPEFWLYFTLLIMGVAAIGVYNALFFDKLPETRDEYIISNIASYFMAIVATGSVGLMFNKEKYISRAILLIALFAITITIILYFFCKNVMSYTPALVGVVFSLIIWWIGNADNTNIIEENYDDHIINETQEVHGNNWN